MEVAKILLTFAVVFAVVPSAFTDPQTKKGVTSNAAPTAVFSAEKFERAFFAAMASDPRQKRQRPEFSAPLSAIARKQAADMVQRRYFDHTNPDGVGPNGRVARAGFPMPSEYAAEPKENFIETIGRGNGTAEVLWRHLSNHQGHMEHLLGLDDFWATQGIVGVGVAQDPSRKDVVCVVLTVPKGEQAPTPQSVQSGDGKKPKTGGSDPRV